MNKSNSGNSKAPSDFRNVIQLHLRNSVHTITKLDTILSEMGYSIPLPHWVLYTAYLNTATPALPSPAMGTYHFLFVSLHRLCSPRAH